MIDLESLQKSCNLLKENIQDYQGVDDPSIINRLNNLLRKNSDYPPEVIDFIGSGGLTERLVEIYYQWMRSELSGLNEVTCMSMIENQFSTDINDRPYHLVKYLFLKCYTSHVVNDSSHVVDDPAHITDDLNTEDFQSCLSTLDDHDSEDTDFEISCQDNQFQSTEGFILKRHQEIGLSALIQCGFISGIFNWIMGSGKTILFLASIQKHLEIYRPNKPVYIIICNRKEILLNIFYQTDDSGERRLRTEYITKLKNGSIFNFNQFRLVDLVETRDPIKDIAINGPTIILINTQYFLSGTKFDDLVSKWSKNIQFITYDECHNVTGAQFYQRVLKRLRHEYSIEIIGYSATPLRQVKTAEAQLKDIFGHNGKLNIISTYDLIDALKDGTILPFKFYLYETDQKIEKDFIDSVHRQLVENAMNRVLPELPYRKIIIWTRTIKQAENWRSFFIKKFPQLKVYLTHSRLSGDVNQRSKKRSESEQDGLDRFINDERDSVLVAVGRCREGSDINNLDCGIWLDFVKKRSTLVGMQTSGRVTRPDTRRLKKYGIMLDMMLVEPRTDYQNLTLNRIIDYYRAINHLSGSSDQYSKVLEMFRNTSYDPEKHQIKISVDDNPSHDSYMVLQQATSWDNFCRKLVEHYIKSVTNSKDEEQRYYYHLLQTENDERYHKGDQLLLNHHQINEFYEKLPSDFRIGDIRNQIINLALPPKLIPKIRSQYYETREELVKACQKVEIAGYGDYVNKYTKDAKLPNIDLIDAGLYGDRYKDFNLTLILKPKKIEGWEY